MAKGDVAPPPNLDIPPPGAPIGAPKSGASAWINSHKGLVAGLGIVVLVGGYVLIKKKSSSSASGTTPAVYELAPGTGDTTGTGGTTSGAGGGGGSGSHSGMGSSLSSTLQAIEAQIAALAASQNGGSGAGGATTGTGKATAANATSGNGPTYTDVTVGPGDTINTPTGSTYVDPSSPENQNPQTATIINSPGGSAVEFDKAPASGGIGSTNLNGPPPPVATPVIPPGDVGIIGRGTKTAAPAPTSASQWVNGNESLK